MFYFISVCFKRQKTVSHAPAIGESRARMPLCVCVCCTARVHPVSIPDSSTDRAIHHTSSPFHSIAFHRGGEHIIHSSSAVVVGVAEEAGAQRRGTCRAGKGSHMGRRQDCRLLLRDVARLMLYPIYLLNMVVVGLGCCLCAVRVSMVVFALVPIALGFSSSPVTPCPDRTRP